MYSAIKGGCFSLALIAACVAITFMHRDGVLFYLVLYTAIGAAYNAGRMWERHENVLSDEEASRSDVERHENAEIE